MPASDPTPLVGEYSSPAPSLDTGQYKTVKDLNDAVSDLTLNSGNAHGSLSGSSAAEAWYRMESDVNAATKRLGEINDSMAKEIKALKDSLAGDAGDALQKYANDILKESEDLFQTLDGKKYGSVVGNVGHAIQVFANGWWDIIKASDDSRDKAKGDITTKAQSAAYNSTTTNAAVQAYKNCQADLDKMNKDHDDQLVKDLQAALAALGGQYTARGGDLVPLKIVNGMSKAHDQRFGGDGKPATTPAPTSVNGAGAKNGSGTGGSGTGGSGSGADQPVTKGSRLLWQAQPGADNPSSATPGKIGDTPDAVNSPHATTPGPGSAGGGPATGTAGSSPALDQAKANANEAIGNLTSPSGSGDSPQLAGTKTEPTPPDAAQLDQAKSAAGQAIGDLTSPSSGGVATGSDGLPAEPGTALAPGVPAMGGGSGAGTSPDDTKRKQALDDAKSAADQAIGDLTGPSGTPSTESGGPGRGAPGDSPDDGLSAAKEAAGKAIDGLGGPDDSPERRQAIDEAKTATQQAVGDAGAANGDPKALQQAKEAADKAINALGGDPSALDQAKAAAHQAIENAGAPSGGAGTPGDPSPHNPVTTSADPVRTHALDEAKSAADKAIDALANSNDTPAEKQALADAKAAVDKAIDNTPGSSALTSFLGAGSSGGGAPAGGSGPVPDFGGGPGGGSGGGGLPDLSGGPGGGAAGGGGSATPAPAPVQSDAQFDTQPGTRVGVPAQALASAAVPAGEIPGGAGQGGMPMGGMGGMGGGMGAGMGGQENKEREPQIWLQADKGAWDDPEAGAPQGPVVGKD